MTLRWREMDDDEREREYSPSSCLPNGDYRPFVEAYRQRSDEAWARLEESAVSITTLAYGDASSQTVDVAVPASGRSAPPLLVFFHGGYWQELSKLDARFAAGDCIERGWAFAAVGYSLAPKADLATIVDECRRATRALHAEAVPLGFDPTRIFVAGSSAGAHLAAMVASDPDGLPDLVSGAVLVSGVFELEPLIGTSIDEALGLTAETAARHSPLRFDLEGFPPSVVAYGTDETAEFKAQSDVFTTKLHEVGTPVSTVEVPERNHFDVILDLAAPGTSLGEAVAALIEASDDNAN